MYKTHNARSEVFKAVLLNSQAFSDLMLFHWLHFTRLSKARYVFLVRVRQFILQ